MNRRLDSILKRLEQRHAARRARVFQIREYEELDPADGHRVLVLDWRNPELFPLPPDAVNLAVAQQFSGNNPAIQE